MFVKSRNNFIVKVVINVGNFLGCEKAEDAHITLREMAAIDVIRLKDASKKGEQELLEFFKGILPEVLIDHDFFATDAEKMKNEEVAEIVFGSMPLATYVIEEYTKLLNFTQRSKTAK